jgi:hypothetical protein
MSTDNPRTTKALAIAALAGVIALPACNRGAVRSPVDDFPQVPPGKVLILPPRDMVQGGGFHAISPGTGNYLLGRVRPQLEQLGWKVLTTDAPGFSNVSIAEVGAAIAEGRRQNADYVFRLVLGEFLDAFPMTFRPDYVTLQSAELWSTRNAALVWSISVPLVSQGTNLRSYHRLIDELAEVVIDGLTTARVDPTVFTRKEPLPVALPATPEPEDSHGAPQHSMGSCTMDQVLTMKNSGMTDAQVKRACTK